MNYTVAIAAAAMLFPGSVQATAAPMQPIAAAMRLKGPNPSPPSDVKPVHAFFSGSFVDAAGKRYDIGGTGDFIPSTGMLQYSVELRGYPLAPPIDIIDFGKMSGLGILEDGHFEIHGTMGTKGYILDATGDMSHGRIEGRYRIFGNGGNGQGEFSGL